MSTPDRNAALWYAADGYSPEAKGINGRRVAGASFLKGFLDHADVLEAVALTKGARARREFLDYVQSHPRQLPGRGVLGGQLAGISPVGTVMFPSPCPTDLLWMRQNFGAESCSVCGITHTTATRAVMQGMQDWRAAPQMEWDAIICTSQAVRAATLRNIEMVDEVLNARTGGRLPPPNLPVIPLGIDAHSFSPDPGARARLRRRMGLNKDDILVSTLSRLSPYGKFDPGPLFIALQQAQGRLGGEKRLHFLACGIYLDDHSQRVFEDTARLLMPDVGYTHLDGSDAKARLETRSGSDVFTFPIDNIQETFGLAPIEAMAAGLPIVAADWDGIRDTVTPEVGIRIPTRSVSPQATGPEADGFFSETMQYAGYGARLSSMTAIDIPAMTDAFVNLARNEALRKSMGQAARQRAQSVYDWSGVIPQMQDLWAELSAIRQRATTRLPRANPVGPLPMDLFASYPSQPPATPETRFVAVEGPAALAELYKARRLTRIGAPFEKLETVQRVLTGYQQAGDAGISIQDLSQALRMNPVTVERSTLFLLKYGYLAEQ